MTTAQQTSPAYITSRRISELMKGRTLTSFTSGEWDQIISLVEMHIAACEQEARETNRRLAYAYGPRTLNRYNVYRERARSAERYQYGR